MADDKVRKCEDCGEEIPKTQNRVRCNHCGLMICHWCNNHVHNTFFQGKAKAMTEERQPNTDTRCTQSCRKGRIKKSATKCKCANCWQRVIACPSNCDFKPICKGFVHEDGGHYCWDAGGRKRLTLAAGR